MPDEAINQNEDSSSTSEEKVIDNQDELNSLLDAIDQKSESTDKKEDKSEDKTEDKEYFKKVGTRVFKTEAEYDAFATKNYGEVTRLSGELEKAQKALAENPGNKQAEVDVEKLRMRIKAEDFFEDTPDALNYREEMAAFLRSGKANDEKGRPSLRLAYEKALRADGKEPIKSEVNTTEKESTKKILRSGGSEGGHSFDNSGYNSDNDIKSISDFADSAIAKKF